MPIYAWVIEHPEGLIVVDTGDTARTANPGYFPAWHPYYRFGVRMNVQPAGEIGPQMEAAGLAPGDGRWWRNRRATVRRHLMRFIPTHSDFSY